MASSDTRTRPRTPRGAIPAETGATAGSSRLGNGGRPTIGIGAAGKRVAEDMSALIEAHVALAKAEIQEGIKAKGAGAGAFGAAGILGWLGLQGLLITVGFVLAIWLPAWAAAAIVTAVLLLLAAIAALVGRAKMRTPVSLDQTKANLNYDVAVVKSHLPSRSGSDSGGAP